MRNMQAIGHLGADAILNNVQGTNVLNFSVATTDTWKNAAGEKQSRTVWIGCAYWNRDMNLGQYLKKGAQVFIQGIPDARGYTDRQGQQGVELVCRIDSLELIGSKREEQPATAADAQQPAATPAAAPAEQSADAEQSNSTGGEQQENWQPGGPIA